MRHKSLQSQCKSFAGLREQLAAVTQSPKPWKDLMFWIEYHHTTLINCAVASMNLPSNPPRDDTHIFFAALSYLKEDLPAERRFRVNYVDLRPRDEMSDRLWRQHPR